MTQAGGDQTYYSITFPTSNEDIGNEHLSPSINNLNYNLAQANNRVSEIPNINSNIQPVSLPQPIPHSDDEFEFVREFAWTLFQGSKIPSPAGNLILSPLLIQMQLSLLRKVATGKYPDGPRSTVC